MAKRNLACKNVIKRERGAATLFCLEKYEKFYNKLKERIYVLLYFQLVSICAIFFRKNDFYEILIFTLVIFFHVHYIKLYIVILLLRISHK